jgi:hypothetical protein
MRGIYKACTLISLLVAAVAYAQPEGRPKHPPKGHVSAQVWGGGEAGGYRQGFAAESLWKVGASASGSLRTQRTLFKGSFGYSEEHGKNMLTSMFIEPGYFPVDVLEFTPGNKVRQTYDLSGLFETRLANNLYGGGKAVYRTANYAKLKDIRHTTYGMSLLVEPSLGYRSDNVSASARMIYRKKQETIDAEQVGSATGESYFAFLDKGLRYGTYQVWDGDGVHLDEAGVGVFPVGEKAYGGGVSLSLGGDLSLNPTFQLDVQALATDGKVGEKGYLWFRFPGYEVAAVLSGSHLLGFSSGRWKVAMTAKADRLDEAVLEKVTTGGVTVPEIYGYNTVSDRAVEKLSAEYALSFISWFKSVGVKADVMTRQERSFLMYPYSYGANTVVYCVTLSSEMLLGPVGVKASFNGGAGKIVERQLSAPEGDEILTQPFRLQKDWDRKSEFMTAPHIGASVSLKWFIPSVKGLGLIADAFWRHGFNITVLPGKNRAGATAGLSYEF